MIDDHSLSALVRVRADGCAVSLVLAPAGRVLHGLIEELGPEHILVRYDSGPSGVERIPLEKIAGVEPRIHQDTRHRPSV